MHSQGLGQEREDGTLSPERALKRQRVSVPSVAIGCGEADTLWAKIHVKHPHVRGEESYSPFRGARDAETPPLAWGGEREIIGYFPINHTKSISKTHKLGKMLAKMEKNEQHL